MDGARPSRDQRGKRSGGRLGRLAGMRVRWRTVDDGEFFCPACGGDRNYRRRTGRRRLVLLGVPLVPRGEVAPVLECASCRGHFGTEALDHPTTTRLSALLRDAVQAVAFAVLSAGGGESRAVRGAAVHAMNSAGYEGVTEEQLVTLLAAAESSAVSTEIELHEALAPLAPHLAAAGRESLLLHGARIALADGPYGDEERAVLAAIGSELRLEEPDVDRLLAQARTPH